MSYMKQVYFEYQRLRAKHWRAIDAIRAARVRTEFEREEYNQNVLFGVKPDDTDICDLFDPSIYTTRQWESVVDRANDQGIWGIVGYVRCPRCGKWESVDSIWGFVGDDWQDSGYDIAIMENTLVALRGD